MDQQPCKESGQLTIPKTIWWNTPVRENSRETDKRKIVLTGASGAIGPYFVDYITAKNIDLLLVGRDADKLRAMFPNVEAATYDDWAKEASNVDILIHLAVANNERKRARQEFWSANVELPIDLASTAKTLGIKLFINVSTYQIFDASPPNDYVKSKIEAKKRLDEQEGIIVKHVILPYVKTDRWRGKVSILNNFPSSVSGQVFGLLSAIKPTVVAEDVPKAVLDDLTSDELLVSNGQAGNFYFHLFKTTTDYIFVLTLLLGFWWLLILCWLGIKLTSNGPGILKQPRVGRHCKVFNCLKFRTMYLGSPVAGTHELSAKYVTPVGKFLRKTKFDELPQIFNILFGSMSLIGPRPCLPTQTELIEARLRRDVYSAKPGISGLAQVNGIDMADPELLARIDQQYIKRQSILLEIRLLIMTFLGRGSGDRTKTL